MNYQNIYDQLITGAQTRPRPDCYCEEHHILPECMGGLDGPENLVYLTAREHLLVHLILIKIYPTNEKLIHAAFRMSNMWQYGTKEYAWVKEKALPVFVKSGLETKNNKLGFHNPEVRMKGSKAGGKATKEKQVGIFDPKHRGCGGRVGGKIGGKTSGANHVKNKTGICDPVNWKKGALLGGKKAVELKVGAHARTKEQMVKDGKKGGEKTGVLPWWYNPITGKSTRSKTQPDGFLPGRKTKEKQKCYRLNIATAMMRSPQL